MAIKAQVLTGGRGKAGGIKVVSSPREAEEAAEQILGMDIRGHTVRRVYVEARGGHREGVLPLHHRRPDGEAAPDPVLHRGRRGDRGGRRDQPRGDRQAATWTRSSACFPTRCVRSPSPPGWKATPQRAWARCSTHLYKAFEGLDASLVEINPLVVTGDGRVLTLDAKVTVDNSSLYRHEDIAELHDVEAADPQEQRAQEVGLQYVKLEGDVGILGNGAGLVMSTLDVVAQAGGEPANFCDVGGGADAEQISTALDIVTSNEQVRSVLFNIFGGITRGDEVARGLLSAIERTGIDAPHRRAARRHERRRRTPDPRREHTGERAYRGDDA